MAYCSDLGVSNLLILQHSLQRLETTEHLPKSHYPTALDIKCSDAKKEDCQRPETMALVAAQRGFDVAHSSHESWQSDEKASKLQTLFQISVTALAFLSFGGYLLCLIVQSIKSKGTTYFHPAASTVATTNGIKRIKVYRRGRRSSLLPMEQVQPYSFYGYNSMNPYQSYEVNYRKFN